MIISLRSYYRFAFIVLLSLVTISATAQVGPAGVNSGIVLWLDGANVNNTSPATNPANGTAVTTWKDISGNNNNATILAGQNTPVMNSAQINGKDVMKFTRTTQVLGTVYNVPTVDIRSTAKPQLTIFTVYRQGTKTAGDWHGVWGDDNGNWDRFFMPSFGTNNGVVSVGPPTNNVAVTNSGVPGQTTLLTTVYDHGVANGSTVYLNALPVQTVTDNSDPTLAQTTLRIGWDGDDNAYNGDIAEMIVYNRKLTSCEIVAVNRYLGIKYGVSLTSAVITPAPNAYFCTGGNTVLTSTTATTYQWQNNSVNIGAATLQTYTANTAGNYRVITGYGGCFDTSAVTVVKEVTPVVYVDGTVASSGTGASWASPLKTVTEALDMANNAPCAATVWVKKGTYYPMKADYITVAASRDSSFRINRGNISLYGGFAGTETLLTQRNISLNPTILSGDLGVANDTADNAYHVMTIIPAGPANPIVTDGFTIQKGNGNNIAGSVVINNVVAVNRFEGGGIWAYNANLTLDNNIFQFNAANSGGGIAAFGTGTISMTKDSLADNFGLTVGGGMYIGGTNLLMNNVAFVRDSSDFGAGLCVINTTNVTADHCRFHLNKSGVNGNSGGGGIYNSSTGTNTYSYCSFYNNTADANTIGSGAGYQQSAGVGKLINCVIANNHASGTADDGGGGIMLYGGTLTVSGCSISDNTTTSTVKPNANSISTVASTTLTLDNTIVWGAAPNQMHVLATVNYNYSDVKGIAAAGTNICANPCFVNPADADGADNVFGTADDGLNLVVCAPPANKGSNALITAGITTDMDAGPRIQQTTVDMGAYESNLSTPVVYVDGSAPVGGNGTSWASPLKTVTQALDIANFSNCVNEIWVKANTYYPMISPTVVTANRDSSFRIIRNGIKIYGGFAGTETLLTQRNVTANPTILSGDIGIAGNTTDNVYHVFTVVGTATTNINNTTIIDGFTIRDGSNNAGGSFVVNGITLNKTDGGGILLAGNGTGNVCSPLIQNNIFTNNNGIYGCGIYCMSQTGGVSSPAINNCSFISNAGAAGAAMSAFGANSSPIVNNCIFTSNSSTGNGGALDMNGTAGVASPVFTSCTFTGNSSAGSGGAASNTGVAVTPSAPQYVNCTFSNNTSNSVGAGIYSSTANLSLTGSNLHHNRSQSNGGAVSSSGGVITLSVDTLSYNFALNWGGAGWLQNGTYTVSNLLCLADTAGFGGGLMLDGGTGTVSNSKIMNNRVNNSGAGGYVRTGTVSTWNYCIFYGNSSIPIAGVQGSGGGFQSEASPVTILNNCVFANNIAGGPGDDGGGGIMNYAGTMTINDATFSENTTLSTVKPNANSISVTAGGNTTINNSIVWGSAANQIVNLATLTSNYSDLKGIAAAGSNLNTDPLFINAADPDGADNTWGTADDGLKLLGCSLSINTGSNALIPAIVTTDMTAGPRILEAIVDMGAYENIYVAPPVQSVTIAITAGTQTICPGSSVTFTATPVNGGATPFYQWQVNGINAGTNSPTFTSTTLANNDMVTVIMTSSLICFTPPTATSNGIQMTVTANVAPAVTIAITTGSQTICAGSSVTFTATPTNGGTTPVYQWQVNGINAGTNSTAFTSTTLANNDIVTVIMTSNASCALPASATSNAITMTVNPNLTPSVSIAITTGSQTICAGTSVTFTATPTNGGTTPIYQWQVNGINAGTNSPTFTSATLANGDIIKVRMTSNFGCLASNNPVSNTITMTVNPNLTPSVSIAITAGAQNICAGTSVTFTATPTNGGTTPIYQWQVNGINAGTNAATFTSATLANNDIVTVIMTSNFACPASNNPTSNSITMTVSTNLTPSVNIAITSGAQTICAGTSVTFTATPANGGTAPAYQWKVNGVNAGTNSNTFTSTTLANNDVVTVVLTSNETCLASNNPTSNAITMTVNPNLTPAVSIAITIGAQAICAGTSVTFTATATNGGTTPAYQWKVNGINAGTNAATFTSATLANGDIVTVVMTSNFNCLASNNPVSNAITMTVNPNLTPSVSISITSGAQTICAGTSVTFTATATNGGTTPVYQWKVNGINAGTNAATFTSTTLANGDAVTVVLTSNEACLASNNPTSNSITMTVNPNLTPTVSIAITAGSSVICAGSSVTFTATPTNGGTVPAYQWKINGINAGTNSATFTTTTLANNDVVTVVLTSNETCLAANNVTSNSITMTVNPLLTPSVTIAITAGAQTICAFSYVTFTATPVNGGTAPAYQWKVNGLNAGTNSSVFTTNILANGDVVTVVLTSNETCLASNNPTSNSITMTVNPNLTPAVTISTPNSTVCPGDPTTFTAIPVNGGTNPHYHWKINGGNAGFDNPVFTYGGFSDGDIVTVFLTSSETCLTANNVISNSIPVTVAPIPVLTLSADNTEILTGGVTALHVISSEPISSYAWTPSFLLNNPAAANPVATPDQTTLYQLVATSSLGCKGTGAITINVVKGPQIANTFTPNNDGIHDFWEIKNLETYPDCRIQVFTRTGQLVFKSRGYKKPWDGNYRGKPLPFDTYYYILELNNRIGTKPVTGYITIVK